MSPGHARRDNHDVSLSFRRGLREREKVATQRKIRVGSMALKPLIFGQEADSTAYPPTPPYPPMGRGETLPPYPPSYPLPPPWAE